MNIDTAGSIGITDVETFMSKLNKRKKKKEPEFNCSDLNIDETKVEILKNLLENAVWMYHSKFSPRDPSADYKFFLSEITTDFYEFKAMRIKAPTETEMTYTPYEYLMTNDLHLEEVQKYIRNKFYCFIHYVYQFHLGEKYGRDENGVVNKSNGKPREKQSKFNEKKVKTKLREEDNV